MQLIIDLGNSQIKYFVFNDDKVKLFVAIRFDQWENSLNKIRMDFPLIKNCIISDVNRIITKDLENALSDLSVIFCSSKLRLPFKTLYKPRSQLGSDRIALLSACALEYPNQNILVIDLGSCITYDILDMKGIHHGGAISPGYHMRYKAMHVFSGQLPSLAPKNDFTLLGTATKTSMHVGVSHGIKAEIIGLICQYEEKFDFLTTILTGGDAKRLPKPLKNSIFAHSNFLAKGLNYLLTSNID